MFKFILKGSIGTIDILELQGIMIEKTTGEIREKLFERIKQGISDIVLLCSGLTQIDSRGISMLIEIADALPKSGKLHLVACPPPIIVPMKSLGMMNFFQFYKTEQEAFQNLKMPDALQDTFIRPAGSAGSSQNKRQVSIKDHIRNKAILFKHYETSTAQDIIVYLCSTYAHFRDKQIELTLRGKPIPPTTTLAQIFDIYGYGAKDMLEIREAVAPQNVEIVPVSPKEALASIAKELGRPSHQTVALPEQPNYTEMMRKGGKLVGEAVIGILRLKDCLDAEQARAAREVSELNQEPISTTLIEGNHITHANYLKALGEFLRCETSSLDNIEPLTNINKILPKEKAQSHCAAPLALDGKKLRVALCNPLDESAIVQLRKLTGLEICPVLAAESRIRHAIDTIYAPPAPTPLSTCNETRPMSGTEEMALFDEGERSHYMAAVTGGEKSDSKNAEIGEHGWQGILPGLVQPPLATLQKAQEDLPRALVEIQNALGNVGKALPGLLNDTLASLHKLEEMLTRFQNLYVELHTKKSSDEVYELVLETASALFSLDCAVILLFPKGTVRFAIHQIKKGNKDKAELEGQSKRKSKPDKKKENKDSSIENLIADAILMQLKKSHNIVTAKTSRPVQLHAALPFMSTAGLSAVLYLIWPEGELECDVHLLQLLAMLLHYAGLLIENDGLKAQLDELRERK